MKKLPKRILAMMLCLIMAVSMCAPAFAISSEDMEQYAKKAANVGIQKITDAIPVIGGGVSAVIDTFLPDLLGIKSDHSEVMDKLAEIQSAIDGLGKQMDSNQQALFQQFYKEKIDAFNKDLTVEKNRLAYLSTRVYEIENQYGPNEIDDKQYDLANLIDDKEVYTLASDLVTLTDYLCATQVSFAQEEGILTLAYKLNCRDSVLGCEAAIKTSDYVNMISSYIESAYTTLFTIALAKLYLYEPLIGEDRDAKLAYDNINSAVFSEKNGTSLRANYNRIFDEDDDDSVINTYNDMILDAWFSYIDDTDYQGAIAEISYIPLDPNIGFVWPHQFGYNESLGEMIPGRGEIKAMPEDVFAKPNKRLMQTAHGVLTVDQISCLMEHLADNPVFGTDDEDISYIRLLSDLGFSFDNYNDYVKQLQEDLGATGTMYRDPKMLKAETDGMTKIFPMSTKQVYGELDFSQTGIVSHDDWVGIAVVGYDLEDSVNNCDGSASAEMARVCLYDQPNGDKHGDFDYDPSVMLLYFTEPLDAPFIGTLFSSLSPATIVLICVGTAAIIAVPTVILVRKKKKAAK